MNENRAKPGNTAEESHDVLRESGSMPLAVPHGPGERTVWEFPGLTVGPEL